MICAAMLAAVSSGVREPRSNPIGEKSDAQFGVVEVGFSCGGQPCPAPIFDVGPVTRRWCRCATIGFLFVRLLYRLSVQVFGWLTSLTRDERAKTATTSPKQEPESMINTLVSTASAADPVRISCARAPARLLR
jgi:hypothetical protein